MAISLACALGAYRENRVPTISAVQLVMSVQMLVVMIVLGEGHLIACPWRHARDESEP